MQCKCSVVRLLLPFSCTANSRQLESYETCHTFILRHVSMTCPSMSHMFKEFGNKAFWFISQVILGAGICWLVGYNAGFKKNFFQLYTCDLVFLESPSKLNQYMSVRACACVPACLPFLFPCPCTHACMFSCMYVWFLLPFRIPVLDYGPTKFQATAEL